jgi:hypothetical protein
MSAPGAYNVTVDEFGAKGDGQTDDAPAITKAIDFAYAAHGGVVLVPAGQYYLKNLKDGEGLVVKDGVTLKGVGWNTIGSYSDPSYGSWICVDAGAQFSPVTITGPGGAVCDLAFKVKDQDATPQIASPMVHIQANDTVVENVFMLNPYCGVFIEGVGRVTVRRLFGQPLSYGIQVDGSKDTNYIEDLHFYPYWGIDDATVYNYQLANGKAIVLRRCDNPHISNIFVSFYNVGLSLEGDDPTTSPHKVHLANADLDCCVTGISVHAMGEQGFSTNLQLTNITIQAPSPDDFPVNIRANIKIPLGHGLWLQAGSAYATVQASNLRITNSGIDAVRIDAGNATFYGENTYIGGWQGSDGICIASSTSKAYLGAGFDYPTGSPTPCHPFNQFHFSCPAADYSATLARGPLS